MSYWNEHEKQSGVYDFSELDWQLDMIAARGGTVSLSLGVKQPRWPEYHWPKWVLELSTTARTESLLMYIQKTVIHVRGRAEITSYQLENEALLQGFGEHIQIDRMRLWHEWKHLRRLDPAKPVLMSTSNGWGIPFRRPRPDIVGFSCYFTLHSHGRYHRTIQSPQLHRVRKWLIHMLLRRPVIIHELQCEPWGPTAIWKMAATEQDKSMSPSHIAHNIAAARTIGAHPIDLWGSEWWYWRRLHGDDSVWHAVRDAVTSK